MQKKQQKNEEESCLQ